MNAHPGPNWLQRMPERFRFVDYGYDATLADMEEMLGLIREHCHPEMRFVVTVSPVPFGATFKDADVIVANSASKSVLRAVAEELFRRHDFVDYFPSYEIVLNSPRAIAFADMSTPTNRLCGYSAASDSSCTASPQPTSSRRQSRGEAASIPCSLPIAASLEGCICGCTCEG